MHHNQVINLGVITDGGAFVTGNVNTVNNFVGRDNIVVNLGDGVRNIASGKNVKVTIK